MNLLTKLFAVIFLIQQLPELNCEIAPNISETNNQNINDDNHENKPLKIDLTSSVLNLTSTDSNEFSHSKKSQSTTKRKASQSTTIIHRSSSSKSLPTLTPKPGRDFYDCPNTSQFEFFPSYCAKHTECLTTGRNYRCCNQFGSKRCVKGVFKPLKEQKHEPILGLIPRKCPAEPLAELFWEIQTCSSDHDCWPRICCPDGRKKYCRTSKPELDNLPVGRQLAYPIESISSYLQCTPAPPLSFDIFPKLCNNTLDCFPNVCCQELGKKHCRPPKRSLLAFVTGFAQQFNQGLIKQWTDNLVIRR